MTITTRRKYKCLQLLVDLLGIALLLPLSSNAITVQSFGPRSSPVAGGSILSVAGEGFISGVSKCQFLHTSYGAAVSLHNIVYNSSFLTCTVPEIKFVPSSLLTPTIAVQFRVATPGHSTSNSFVFNLFDLTQVLVTSISPNEGFNSSTTLVTIHGSEFVNTQESTCVFDGITVSVQYISNTALQCLMPLYPAPTQIVFDLLLNGQVSSKVQTVSMNATSFVYFSTPPSITDCTFTQSFASLLLGFDREIEVGGETSSVIVTPLCCSLVFSVDTLAKLGDGAECSWFNSQQRQVLVHLTPSSTVLPGTLLTINNTTLRTRKVAYSKLASGSIQVQTPSEPLLPVAVITGPDIIPNCGNFFLSGDLSHGGGAKPILFNWNVTLVTHESTGSGGGSGITPTTAFFTLQGMIPNGFTSSHSISLPSESFIDDRRYLVTLTVRNFLGHEQSTELQVYKSPLPAVGVWVVGGREVNTSVDKEVLIEGAVSLPPCVLSKGAEISYKWTLQSSDHIPSLSYLLNPIMFIPARTLRHNVVYTATLTVTFSGHNADTTVTINTLGEPIVARITGGDRVSHGQQKTLLLDSTASSGLTRDVLDHLSFAVDWNCKQLATNDTTCTSQGVLKMNGLQFEMLPNVLSVGEYLFTLSITYSESTYTTNQVVVVVPYNPSTVKISMSSGLVPAHRKLILRGTVSSSLPSRAQWSNVYKPGYGLVSLQQAATPTEINTVDNQATSTEIEPLLYTSSSMLGCSSQQLDLVFPMNNLLPMNTYSFQLRVTDSLNRTSFSEVDIMTGSTPTAGSLTIHPSIGSPILTKFLLRANSWTDSPQDFPLQYRFGFSLIENETVWLSGILQSNELKCRLPLTSADGLVNIVVEIYDNKGAMSTFTRNFNLSNAPLSINLTEIYNDIHDISITKGMWVEGIANALSVLYSLRTTNQQIILLGSSAQEFTRMITQLTIGLFKDKIPRTKYFGLQVLQILQETANMRSQLTESQILSITEIVEMIAKRQAIGSVLQPLGLQDDLVRLVLSIYGNLIAGYSQVVNDQIRSDVVTMSLDKTLPVIGHGVCQQLGVYEESVHVTLQDFGAVKFYYAPLPSDYNLTCSSVDTSSRCSFFVNETSSVLFAEDLINRTRLCDKANENGSDTEAALCIASVQYNKNLHWSGSVYTHQLKSPQVSLHLISKLNEARTDVTGLDGAAFTFSLPIIRSPSLLTNLVCVMWNTTSELWSSDSCTTEVLSMERVLCCCTQLSNTAVIERCASGFYGDKCQQVCTQGLWGEECRRTCSCSNRGTCSAHDGSCDCDPGWTGSACQSACPVNFWGKRCEERCLCQNAGLCHNVDGTCDCPPGWIGDHCQISCPNGFYGKLCNSRCECRVDEECNKISGVCHCSPGYTGQTCNTSCLNGFYGLGCNQSCECITNRTADCSHITGECSCLQDWGGQRCELFTATPSPVPEFPVLAVAVSLVVVLLIVALVAVTIVIVWLVVRLVKKRRSQKISPNDKEMNRLSDELSVHDEDDDDSLNITSSRSLVALQQQTGKKVSFGQSSVLGGFKEPEQNISGEMRWQIIQLVVEETSSSAQSTTKEEVKTRMVKEKHIVDVHIEATSRESPSTPKVEEKETRETHSSDTERSRQSSNARVSEIVYNCGVYLAPTKTLKDLRNAFLDSGQVDKKELFFQFLRGDTPGDLIPIDTEEEIELSSLEPTTNRTMHIEAISKVSAALELCVCGKFADLECGECKIKGYCSVQCQQADWPSHSSFCRLMSAKKRHKEKKRRSIHRKVERLKSAGYTPLPDQCSCGKEADFECSQCGRQGYCSRECQLRDWQIHRHFCS